MNRLDLNSVDLFGRLLTFSWHFTYLPLDWLVYNEQRPKEYDAKGKL